MAYLLAGADLIAAQPTDVNENAGSLPVDAWSIVSPYNPFSLRAGGNVNLDMTLPAAWQGLAGVVRRPDTRMALTLRRLPAFSQAAVAAGGGARLIGWANAFCLGVNVPRFDIDTRTATGTVQAQAITPVTNQAALSGVAASHIVVYRSGLQASWALRAAVWVHECRHYDHGSGKAQKHWWYHRHLAGARDLRWVYQSNDSAFASAADSNVRYMGQLFDPNGLVPASATAAANLTGPEFTSLTPAVRSQMAVRAFRFSPSAFQFEAQYLIDMLAVFGPTALSPGSLSQQTQIFIQGRINTILTERFIVSPNWVPAPPASVIFEVW